MLVGIISDTHMQNKFIRDGVNKLKECDVIIHLGDNIGDVEEIEKHYDGRIISVKGNCDYCKDEVSERVELIDNKKFFITHGHNYNVKNTLINLKYKAEEVKADVVLFGHTHIANVLFEAGIWYINPGSAGMSRTGKNSVALIKICHEKILPEIILL